MAWPNAGDLPYSAAVKGYVDAADTENADAIAAEIERATAAEEAISLGTGFATPADITAAINALNLGTVSALAADTDPTLTADDDLHVPTDAAIRAYIDAIISGLASVYDLFGAANDALTAAEAYTDGQLALLPDASTDGTFASPSDTEVPTALAVYTFITALLSGKLDTTATETAGNDLTGTLLALVLSGTVNVEEVVRAQSLDQMSPPASNVNMNGVRLMGVADAAANGDAVSRSFGDARYQRSGLRTVADAAVTAAASDRLIGYTSLTSTRLVTLAAASAVPAGTRVTIADFSGSCGTGSNIIEFQRAGTDTVNGVTTPFAMFAPYASATLVSDGVSQWVIDHEYYLNGLPPLIPSNNLSDVGSAKTARANLDIESRTTVADVAYTALATDRVVAFTSLSSIRVVTLPLANSVNAGAMLTIMDQSGSCGTGANIIQIARQGTDTLNGGTTNFALFAPYASAILVSDGTSGWYIVNEYLLDGVAPMFASKNLSDVASAQTANRNIMKWGRTTVADAAHTVTTSEGPVIAYTSLTTGRTVTLPSATTAGAGFVLIVKDEANAAATSNITVSRAGSDTIEGATTKVINTNFGELRLYSNGSNEWFQW